jgi:hypothetical protein
MGRVAAIVPEGPNDSSQVRSAWDWVREKIPSRRDRTIVARYAVPGIRSEKGLRPGGIER